MARVNALSEVFTAPLFYKLVRMGENHLANVTALSCMEERIAEGMEKAAARGVSRRMRANLCSGESYLKLQSIAAVSADKSSGLVSFIYAAYLNMTPPYMRLCL